MLPLLLADHTAQAQQVDALSLRRGFQDLSRPQVARDYLNYWMLLALFHEFHVRGSMS
jgi:hypothetical protein